MNALPPDAELSALLAPESVVVVGASGRPGRKGYIALESCLRMGMDGPVYPITPRYDEVLGVPCLPDISALPGPIDLAILAGSNERLESDAERVLEAGARSLVVMGTATDRVDGTSSLRGRLTALAREANVPLLGPGSLGYVNFASRTAGSGVLPMATGLGRIAIVVQSGMLYWEALRGDPRLDFSFCAHTGLEASLTAADLIRFALELPSTRAVGVYLEVARDAESLIDAFELALDRDVPVVVLRPGRTENSRRQIATHAARLAGRDASYEALFRRYGVEAATSNDEWWATIAMLAADRRPGPGGLAAICNSGGQTALLIDHADETGVKLAKVSRETESRLREVLSPNLAARNPAEFWDGERDVRAQGEACLRPLVEDEATALAMVFSAFGGHDPDPDGFEASTADVTRAVARDTVKPVVAATYSSRQTKPDLLLQLAREGITTLDGMKNALLAVRHAFAYRDMRQRLRRPYVLPTLDVEKVDRWRERLASGESMFEREALGMLSDCGIPSVLNTEVNSEAEAVAVSRQLGCDVAVKTAEQILHKSEAGGVHLGLRTSEQVAAAYRDLAARLGPRALVAPMVSEGVEVALGVVVDDFGAVVMLAAGGTLVELLDDRCFLLAPVPPDEVRRALGELRLARLLAENRGRPPSDIDALCNATSRLSVLAHEVKDVLAEVDINPIIVTVNGCVAVDAIVQSRDARSAVDATA